MNPDESLMNPEAPKRIFSRNRIAVSRRSVLDQTLVAEMERVPGSSNPGDPDFQLLNCNAVFAECERA